MTAEVVDADHVEGERDVVVRMVLNGPHSLCAEANCALGPPLTPGPLPSFWGEGEVLRAL